MVKSPELNSRIDRVTPRRSPSEEPDSQEAMHKKTVLIEDLVRVAEAKPCILEQGPRLALGEES
jgi:hypothetical protein